MTRLKKWRRIFAMFLAVVMMTQNVQVIMAGVTTEELNLRTGDAQEQEVVPDTQNTESGSVDTGSDSLNTDSDMENTDTGNLQIDQAQIDTRAEGGEYEGIQPGTDSDSNELTDDTGNEGDTTGETVSNNVSADIVQEIYQQEIDGYTYNFVQMTANVTNNDGENAASGVDIKVLLPQQLSYVTNIETPDLRGFNNPAEAVSNDYDMSEISEDTIASWQGQVIMWCDQTIGAGETATYTFSTQILDDITDVSGLNIAWYVGGFPCSYSWQNTELLTPPQEPEAPETNEDPTPAPEVKPETDQTDNGEEGGNTEDEITPDGNEEDGNTEDGNVEDGNNEDENTEDGDDKGGKQPELDSTTPTLTPELSEEEAAKKQAEQEEIKRRMSQRKNLANILLAEGLEQTTQNEEQNIVYAEANELGQFISNVVMYTSDGSVYDPKGAPIPSNGYASFKLTITESDTKDNEGNIHQIAKDRLYTYVFPTDLIKHVDRETGDIIDTDDDTKWGEYEIYTNDDGKLALDVIYTSDKIDVLNTSTTVTFTAQFNKEAIGESTEGEIKFGDSVSITVKFSKPQNITATKEAGEYDSTIGKNGGFKFLIKMHVDADTLTPIEISDQLGYNLKFADGLSVTSVSGQEVPLFDSDTIGSPFTIKFNSGLKAGDYEITYNAEIVDGALDRVNGAVPGLTNAATIKNNNEEIKVEHTIDFSNIWVSKSGSQTGNGREAEWRLKVNESAIMDIGGKSVTDKLISSDIYYNTNKPVTLYKIVDGEEVEPRILNWGEHISLSEDKRSWSYNMPLEAGAACYVFKYYTISTKDGIFYNKGSVGSAEVSGDVYISTGTGNGNGIVKSYVGTTPDKKYVKWQSKITVDKSGSTSDVIYKDTLFGNHVFEVPLSIAIGAPEETPDYTKIYIQGVSEESITEESLNDTREFSINFGKFEETSQNTEIILTYYSKVTGTGNLENLGVANIEDYVYAGKDSTTISSFGIQKSGQYNDRTKKITWTVYIENGTGGWTTFTDEYKPEYQSILPETIRIYEGSTPLEPQEVYVRNKSDDKRGTFTFEAYLRERNSSYTIQYESELKNLNNSVMHGNITVGNKITGGGIEGAGSGEVTIPSNVFDKNSTPAEKVENKDDPNYGNYIVHFELKINENKLNLSDTFDDYYIVDTMSGRLSLLPDTIKIVDGTTRIPIPAEDGEGYDLSKPYYTYSNDEKAKKLTVTIYNGNPNYYLLTYDAKIEPNESGITEDVSYSNEATFSIADVQVTDKVESKVTIEQDSSASATSRLVAVKVRKVDRFNNTQKLGGAEFAIYEGAYETLDAAKAENQRPIATATTSEEKNDALGLEIGEAYFGQIKPGEVNGVLYSGRTYTIFETEAPAGYKIDSSPKIITLKSLNGGTTNVPTGSELYAYDASIFFYDIPVTSLSVKKEWEGDNNNKDGNRPSEIEVTLQQTVNNVTTDVETVKLNAPKWNKVWKELPTKDRNGKITYSVVEKTQNQNYTCTISEPEFDSVKNQYSITLTNTYKEEYKDVKVKKEWVDNNNQDGHRPAKITVTLNRTYEDGTGEPVTKEELQEGQDATQELSSENNWSCTWNHLKSWKNGKEVQYTVTEEIDYPDGTPENHKYTAQEPVINTQGNITTITLKNELVPEKVNVSAEKVWSGDADNEDGNRPSSITFELWKQISGSNAEKVQNKDQTIKPDAQGKWRICKWNDLPKYEDGKLITYTVKEKAVTYYTVEYSGDQDESDGFSYKVTNTYQRPSTKVKVIKTWTDDNNRDGKRPSKIKVTVKEKTGSDATTDATFTKTGITAEVVLPKDGVPDNEKWSHQWNDLLKYRNGTEIEYTVTEEVIENGESLEGYKPEIKIESSDDGFIVNLKNKRDIETVDIAVKKVWDDNNNQDSVRNNIAKITFTLKADDVKQTDKYIEISGAKILSTDWTEWSHTWSGLPRYKDGGTEINYTAEEEITYKSGEDVDSRKYNNPPSYSEAKDPKTGDAVITITNKYTPEKISIKATKLWDDNNDQDGLRTKIENIQLQLQKKVRNTYENEGAAVLQDKFKNNDFVNQNGTTPYEWYQWDDLDKYANGKLIEYRVVETINYVTEETRRYTAAYNGKNLELSSVNGEDADKSGVVTIGIKNTFGSETIDISAQKFWDDGEDRDNLRQYVESVAFRLSYRLDGESAWTESETKIMDGVNARGNFTVTWEALPKYQNGKIIEYKVTETVNYQSGTSDSRKYEKPVYSSESITGDTADKSITVKNTHIPETVSLDVEKIWEDANNTDNYRPQMLEVVLMKQVDGETPTEVTAFPSDATVKSAHITLNAANQWKGNWNKLYKYENGKEITYTVKEIKEADWSDKYEDETQSKFDAATQTYSFTLTNTHKPDLTDLTVQKNWDDGANKDKLRPDDIEVVLKADGVQVGEKIKLSESNKWQYTWENLPVNREIQDFEKEDYHRIVYTVEETTKFSEGTYKVSYKYVDPDSTERGATLNPAENSWKTCVIINTHETDDTRVVVMKYWNDNNSEERPQKVTFDLLQQTYNTAAGKYNEKEPVAGSEVTITGTSAQNMWQYTWEKLPRKVKADDPDEKEIIYYVREVNVPEGYTSIVTGEKNIYTAVNILSTLELHKTDITGEKELAGATMALYAKEALEANPDAEPITSWTSGDKAHVITSKEFKELVPGKTFVLRETAAPSGYTLAQDVEFTINYDGKVQQVYMRDDVTKPQISKVTFTDDRKEVPLAGATLQIIDSATNKPVMIDGRESWVTTGGPKVISGLPAGKYTLRELDVPKGYHKALDIDFELTPKGEVKVNNEAVKEIKMIDYPVMVSFSKKDASGNKELPGATLALYHVVEKAAVDAEETDKKDVPGELVERWDTTTEAHVVKNLEIGEEYVLVEEKAPAGYGLAEDVRFTVESDSLVEHIQYVTMTDKKPNISINKVADTGTEVHGLSGALLQIKKGDHVIEEWTSDGTPYTVKDENNELIVGETYTLHEEKAPAGYLLADDIVFRVEADGKATVINKDNTEAGPVNVITMTDKARIVKVLKTDEKGNALAGATLQIVTKTDDKEHIVEPAWITTGEAHVVEAKLEPDTKYYLQETEAPAGYTIAEEVEFTLEASADGAEIEPVVITMENTKTSISISKKAITGTDSLGGAELRILDAQGKVVVEKWTTTAGEDKTVEAVLSVNVPYTLEEVTPPAGYAKAANITFTLNDKGEIIIDGEKHDQVVMRDAKTSIKVSKTDITGEAELVGAVLQILDGKDSKNIIDEWTTTETPHIVEGLTADYPYILHEKTAPKGYAYAEDIKFTVNADSVKGNEQKIVMHDEKNAVLITKTDLSGTKELPGAKLQLQDLNGNVLESWTSTNEEYKITKQLVAGEQYILHEVSAPDGYALAEDIKFTVNLDGTPTKVVMKDAPTKVTISKTDLTGTKHIAGAVLQLLDAKGREIDRWTSDGTPHTVEAGLIEGGVYTLHEVSAPGGYHIAKDIEFTVQKDGRPTQVTMKDAPTVVKILKTDENGKGLSGAALVLKDSAGKEIDKWTSDGTAHTLSGILVVGGEYTLSEVSAPNGYTIAKDQKFTVTDAEVTEVTMKNYPDTGFGKITVTKKVSLLEGLELTELTAKDDTFYVNLFTDAEGKNPYRGAAPKALHLVNASTATVTFDNLANGTYYVYETDAAGSIVKPGELLKHNGTEFVCRVEGGTNAVALDFEAGNKEGYVNLNNVFYEFPDQYSYRAWIDINKKVLRGTSQTTVNDTFYAGIFTRDAEGIYELFTVVKLEQNATVSVEVPLGGENGDQPIKYYVLETNAEGDIVDLDEFAYEVSGEGSVALDINNTRGKINLVNKLPGSSEGKLIVQKVDGEGVGLAGAIFRMTDADGAVVEEWTSEASAHEILLTPGKYTLKELKAPTGYAGAGQIAVTVDENYNITADSSVEFSLNGNVLKYVNKRVPSIPTGGTVSSGGGSGTGARSLNTLSGKVAVKTGDDTPVGMYLALLLAALALTAGGVIYKKKKNR